MRLEELQRCATPAKSNPHLVHTLRIAAQSRADIGDQMAKRSTDNLMKSIRSLGAPPQFRPLRFPCAFCLSGAQMPAARRLALR
jgi:hypothetical protein